MSSSEIKDAIINRVKLMKNKDAALFYGHMLERENYNDKDFFEKWKDIPAQDKISIEKGLDDLQKGRKKNFDSFAKSFAKKHNILIVNK